MHISRFRTGVAALSVCLLSWTIIRVFAQESKNAAMPPPNGLVVVLPPGKQKESLEIRALKNPFVSGVAVQMNCARH